MKYLLVIIGCLVMMMQDAEAQQKMTKEQILGMTIEQLSDLPLEELMEAVEILGVTSVDELFQMIMNKSVSSASKREEDTFVSPLSSSVLTKGEIRMYGATTIEEALKLVPGVIVQQKTNGVYDIQLRGLSNVPDNNMLCYIESSNVLLMVDGRAAFNYALGSANLDRLPISIEDIERIEVVRGASSALYGANAVQGVINIITDKPNVESKAVQGSIQMGSMNTSIADIALRKCVNDKLALGITFNIQLRDRPTDKIYVFDDGDILGLPDSQGNIFNYDYGLDAEGNPTVTGWHLANPIDPGYYSKSEVLNMYYITSTSPYPIPMRKDEYGELFANRFDKINVGRNSLGFNGYITLTPKSDVRVDITGGYVSNYAMHQSLTDKYYSNTYQVIKGSYVNINTSIKNLSFRASYKNESGEYELAEPEFKTTENQVQMMLGYDLNIGDLSIRPGIDWMWNKYKDYECDYIDLRREDLGDGAGFLNTSSTLRSITPSLKLDYKVGGFRAVAAVRSDKTNMPDKWNTSWLGALSYQMNQENFVRASYSRGMRSAILLNSSCSYSWLRASFPNQIRFLGSPEASIVKIDNFELGYRTRPNNKVLIDFEAFYSKSTDYGELMSKNCEATLDLKPYLENPALLAGMTADNIASIMIPNTKTLATIQYNDDLGFDVRQIGASMSIDWSISKKLMMKANLNCQKTTIDGYFPYDQGGAISDQVTKSIQNLGMSFGAVAQGFAADGLTVGQNTMGAIQTLMTQGVLTEADLANMALVTKSDFYERPEVEDGHEHKAAPNFYGSLGVMYHPTSALNVAAMLNFMGDREYQTLYGLDKLNKRFTVDMKVGYKPRECVEVFFNGRNLFNNHKRELCFMDIMGGLYLAGINFSF
ncbi:MAG: TonB-dependent receptor [Bacteroidia bacterium]|nr:TonB-dependent receptor [Bacteroidia bacterium]